MAVSGINEHNEARRRGRMFDRKAMLQLMMREEAENCRQQLLEPQETSYDAEVQHYRKLGSPPGMTPIAGHDRSSTDRHRREWVIEQQRKDYSAKLPNRFNSTDYQSQW